MPEYDYAEIANLYARQDHAADAGELTAYADCFAETASLTSNGKVLGTSRAEIVAFRRRIAERPARRLHVTTNLALDDLGPRRVRGRTYLQAYDATEKLVLTHFGTTDDVLVYEPDERWRFASRVLTYAWIDPSSRL